MFKGNKSVLAIAILALIVAIIGVWPSSVGNSDLVTATPGTQLPIEQYIPAVLYNGGIYSTLPIQTTSTLTADNVTIGTNGGTINEIKSTTCNLSTTVANLPVATSSKPFQCAITGVASGDQVYVTLPSDGGSLGGTPGIIMSYAKASTTANGYIEVGLAIPFGGFGSVATSSFPLATTSVQVLYIDN